MDKEVFTEHLTEIVCERLRNDLGCFLWPMSTFSSWPPHRSWELAQWKRETENARTRTETFIDHWRTKKG